MNHIGISMVKSYLKRCFVNKVIKNKILISILRLSFSFEFEATCSVRLIYRIHTCTCISVHAWGPKKLDNMILCKNLVSSDFFHKALQGTKLYSDKTYRKPFLVSHHPRTFHPLPLSGYLNVTILTTYILWVIGFTIVCPK